MEQGALAPAVVSLADAQTIAVDASQGNDFRVTIGTSRTMGNPSNPTAGPERHGVSVGVAAGILAGAQALGGALRIAVGHRSDRIGSRVGPLRVLAFALAAALFLTAAVSAGPAGVAAAVLLLAGALGMSWNGLSFTAATELSGHAQAGAAVGVQQSALNAAAAFVPILFSAVVAATTWGAAFALAALGPLTAGWLLRRLTV